MIEASAFIGSEGSRLLIAFLSAGAVALLVGAITVLLGTRQAKVERQLAGYEVPELASSSMPSAAAGQAAGESESAVVQQAMAFTTRLAERTGLMARTERMLEQADLPVRAGEMLFYTPTFAIIAFLGFAVLFGPFYGLAAGAIVLLAPFAYVSFRQQSRHQRFERQLPDMLALLASSLRAGFSLMQGLEAVAQEISEPMRKELSRVFTEVRLGRPVEDALGDAADRMDSNDLRWTVMAIKIQREVGGNLAILLDTVADTMIKRERIRREIRALTAEGRMSAIVLSLVSPVLALAIWLIQPSYLKPLIHDGIGIVGLVAAISLSVAGWYWLRKIIQIEV